MPSDRDTPEPAPVLRATVLGSGSAGNALAISSGEETVLLDCGFSARETDRRLGCAGIDPSTVRAVLVSHEHSDHLRGVRVFASCHRIPVYASRGTRVASDLDGRVPEVRVLVPGETVSIGSIAVATFRTSHDAAEPLGFRFTGRCGRSLGVLTDSGLVTDEMLEALAGCAALAIESNHDEEMLERGPYPWFLKRRIRSAEGHLSNAAAAGLVTTLATDRLASVVGLHLSSTNNTAHLATTALVGALARLGHPARVEAARQESPCVLQL
ncbi:MAG: MBL fold metallo-hydrolase [Coriobacteriia bacterium]|nr:MBL fold metallo-hydrolase [Coriobacteriia bacterium]